MNYLFEILTKSKKLQTKKSSDLINTEIRLVNAVNEVTDAPQKVCYSAGSIHHLDSPGSNSKIVFLLAQGKKKIYPCAYFHPSSTI